MNAPVSNITVAADAAEALRSVRCLAVPTDADDESLDRARGAALALAVEFGFEVVLYDRSNERWTDTPHPSGPHRRSELDSAQRPHLDGQMREFEQHEVTVTAFLATVPALTAITDVLQDVDVDAVLVPEQLGSPKMMDRIQLGSDPAAMVERVAELQLEFEPVMLIVSDAGRVSLANRGPDDSAKAHDHDHDHDHDPTFPTQQRTQR